MSDCQPALLCEWFVDGRGVWELHYITVLRIFNWSTNLSFFIKNVLFPELVPRDPMTTTHMILTVYFSNNLCWSKSINIWLLTRVRTPLFISHPTINRRENRKNTKVSWFFVFVQSFCPGGASVNMLADRNQYTYLLLFVITASGRTCSYFALEWRGNYHRIAHASLMEPLYLLKISSDPGWTLLFGYFRFCKND
jgi:hypothetical protein